MHRHRLLRALGRRLTLVQLLLLAVWTRSQGVAGADSASPPPTVLLLVLPSAAGPDARLSRFLADAASFELQRSGVESVVAGETGMPEEQLVGADGSLAAGTILAGARQAGTARVLAIRYSVRGETVSLTFSVYDTADGRLMAESASKGGVGLELDDLVSKGMRDLGAWVPPPPEESSPAVAQATVHPLEEAPLPAADQASGQVAQSRGEPGTGPAAPPPPVPVATAVRPEPPAPRVRRLQLDAWGGPLLAVGPASVYLEPGAVVSLFAGYRLPVLSDLFSVGLHLGIDRFDARGAVMSSTNVLAPFGMEARVQLEGGKLLGASASLVGGAALLALTPRGQDTLFKLVPYVYAGVGLSVMLQGVAALGVEVGCQIFLERYYPIVGFVPSGLLQVRI